MRIKFEDIHPFSIETNDFEIGFTGSYCETQIDYCQANPCLNGGICRTLINSYRCDCPQGYNVSEKNFESFKRLIHVYSRELIAHH